MTDDAPFGYTKRGTPRKRPAREGEGGQQPHLPTAASKKQVDAMAGYGIPQEDIALVLDISKPTLRKYYRYELDTGAIRANAKVSERLWKRAAEDGEVSACIWWEKSRMGYSERVRHEHSGELKHSHEHSFIDEFAGRIAGIAARLGEKEGTQKANGSAGPPATR